MEDFEVSIYLEDFVKPTKRGTCKSCKKQVNWSRDSVGKHKRATCDTATIEEKRIFSKRTSASASLNGSSLGTDAENENVEIEISHCKLTPEQLEGFNCKLANFFFRTGISFRVGESEVFKEFVRALNPAYADELPSAKVLAGSLLDKQHERCSKRIKGIIGESKNLTLTSDGWTNVRGDHLVNFSVKAPGHKPIFYKSLDTSGIRQTAEAIAEAIIAVIEEIGAERVVCVVTDNANVMKASWHILEDRFPHISAYGCSAHALNLLIQDILEVQVNADLIKEAERVIKFVKNHHLVKSKYEAKRKAAKVPHTLTMPVATRWFSHYASLNNLMESKYVLIQLADDEEAILREISPKPTSAAVVKSIKSNEFWQRLSSVIKLIEFPTNIIGEFCQKEVETLS